MPHLTESISVRIGVIAGSLLLLFTLVGGIGSWWRGRPERSLAEAERLLEGGNPEAAESYLAIPESTPVTRDRALLIHARIAIEQGQPSRAAEMLNRVDPQSSWATEAKFWKGRTLYAARNPRLAIAWFRDVLERRPDDIEAHRWLAAAAYDLGDWRTAVHSLEVLTRLKPDDAPAWRTLGLLDKEENQFERAQREYELSLKLDSRQPRVRLELAEILIQRGQFAEARTQLNSCRGEVPEMERLDLLTQCLRAAGETAEARAMLDSALEANPNHPGLLAQRALIAQAEGDTASARRCLDRALAEDPFNAKGFYQRSLILRSLGETADADRDLARSAELNRATAEMSKLNTEAAIRPDDPDVRTRLAHLCLQLGKIDLAAYWYRAALACDSGYAPARLGLNALRVR